MKRCNWGQANEKLIAYHDEEWGVPLHDDRKQFEFLMLEVMQCGLNWNMMLQKRGIFHTCFDEFDYRRIAGYDEEDVQRILTYPGMIRSRRKIEAVIHNARCFQAVQAAFGTFDAYLWGFTDGKTVVYPQHQTSPVPRNALSDQISRDLKKRGFKYLGSITTYSHLQACGIINDHERNCFRYQELTAHHPFIVIWEDAAEGCIPIPHVTV